MRVISIEKAQPGMEIGRNIYGAGGEILLAAGVKLTQNYINRLKELGIVALYIQDEATSDIEIDDVISEKTRLEAIRATREAMASIKLNPTFDIKKIDTVVNNIISELLTNKDLLVNIVDIRALNDYTFGHCVNVAVLSLITGIAMGYDQAKLRQLAAGALFHDIGKTAIPDDKLINGASLALEEDEQVQLHTLAGYEILRRIKDFPPESAEIALQHHERFDGSGFPQHLKGEAIGEFSRIVTVADLYDRMTTGYMGKAMWTPFQAMEIIIANRGKFFDPRIVETFMTTIALFPLGTMVMLNTREKAVVVETYKRFPTRPKVRVLADPEGKRIAPPYEIDLPHCRDYFIARILEVQ